MLLSSGNHSLGNNGKVNLSKLLSFCRVLASNRESFIWVMYRNMHCETKDWIWKITSSAFLMCPGMSTNNVNTIVSLFKVEKYQEGCMLGFHRHTLVKLTDLWDAFKIKYLKNSKQIWWWFCLAFSWDECRSRLSTIHIVFFAVWIAGLLFLNFYCAFKIHWCYNIITYSLWFLILKSLYFGAGFHVLHSFHSKYNSAVCLLALGKTIAIGKVLKLVPEKD